MPFRLACTAAVSVASILLVLPASSARAQTQVDHVRYTYATVLSASPAYETVRYPEQREECEDERVIVRERDDGTAGAIVGAIVGGVVGNQVGGGSGRRAATVAGAVAGGTIGRNVDRNNSPQRQYESTERRCRIIEVVREERRQAGFDVEYRLHDEVYHARLPYDPGHNLRVRVSVTPVE